ncbi:MAG: alpha/beta fold hydrolase [Bacteroidetes bacterium]|nr:MAG: alpha/beta fold hydrolase [Bacteroidota bacterium]
MKKTYFTSILVILFFIPHILSGQNPINKKSITGSWIGKISTGAIDLRVIFNLSLIEKDSLVATLDSPDQGAKGIKLGPVTLDGETLKISAGALLAEYNGTIKNDTLIEGTWKQAGNSMVLDLAKLKTAFTVNRPQEPKPPFPYTAEDVTFTNEKFKIKLAGTITIPAGKGPFPAVILITGSGPQNRNEELMGHKPFLVIADFLSRNGIAVLRYDDRGVGKSQGSQLNVTSADLATDAEAAFNFLTNYTKVDPERIGLMGHSEGGLIAPIVAVSNPGIAFIVSLAGPGVTGQQIIIRQLQEISRFSGEKENKIREATETNKKLYAVLRKEKDNKKAEVKILAIYREILVKKKTSKEDTQKAVSQLKTTFGADKYTWFRYFIMTNPVVFWKKVKCPVLALNGEKDLQVAAAENLPAIEKALKSSGNKSVKTMKLVGLNHLFQHCKTGLPSEYANIEETFSPEALKIINDWILGL